jgi:hypothetical protein
LKIDHSGVGVEEKLEKIKLVEYANDLALYALSEYEPDLDNVRAASSGGLRWNTETAARVDQSLTRLMRAFFGSAKVDNVNWTNIPEPFWASPLGSQVARALLWVKQDSLLTMLEGARLLYADEIQNGTGNDQTAMVKLSRLVTTGRITKYLDFTENNPQRRGRVDKRELLALKGHAPEALTPEEKKAQRRDRLRALHGKQLTGS